MAVTGGLLHVAMAVQRGAHFPTGSDVAVFMIFVDGTYTESAAIEQQSTVNSGAHELSTGYPTDLGHFTMSLRKDIMGAGKTAFQMYLSLTKNIGRYYATAIPARHDCRGGTLHENRTTL